MPFSKKIFAIIILLSGAFGLFWILNQASSSILISNARAIQINDRMYAIYLDLQNEGEPDFITSVTAEKSESAFITGGDDRFGIAIPGKSKPSFSSDGAHIMVMIEGNTLDVGEFIPLILSFEKAGTVQVKAVVKEPMKMASGDVSANNAAGQMDHSMHQMGAIMEVSSDAAVPKIEMELQETTEKSWQVDLKTENFEFFEPITEPLVHKGGQGHGHLYLNGLKLQRMYSTSATIGVLPAGKHIISVTLNTNDHKAYVIEGAAISASSEVEVK